MLTSCEGIFQRIYDNEETKQQPSVAAKNATEGKLYVDASSWTKWYYIDLQAITNEETKADSTFLLEWTAYDIPTETAASPDGVTGIYSYWYDVFGEGLSNHEFRSFTPTALQAGISVDIEKLF